MSCILNVEEDPPSRVRQFLEPSAAPSRDVDAWFVTDDRGLPRFFAGYRHLVFGDMARALDGQVVERQVQLRPRDRRPFTVRFEIVREMWDPAGIPRLKWIEPLVAPKA